MLAINLFLYFFLAQKKVTKKGADLAMRFTSTTMQSSQL